MLLKISLGLAILVGLGTIYLTHFQVAPKIATITQERDEAQKAREAADAKAREQEKNAKNAKTALDATKKELNDTQGALKTESGKRTEQEKRANKLAEELSKTTEERNEAQRDLAAWKALGLPIDAIRSQKEDFKRALDQRDAFAEENKIFARENKQLKAELRRYTGDQEVEPKLPAGLKGKVVAVDPKYDFVILDIGGNQGVVENGRLLVNRNGRLVAKVKVTSVQPNRSVANILPEWKQDEVMEGDQVLY
jgi:chromosome segregation ATPase